MVEYSNIPASESEIASSYTEAGYNEAFADPKQAADDMIASGINVESVTKLRDVNDKSMAPSPMLKKKKWLKKLFLQYIRKYVSNPAKYIDHPKQIRNLPSWFDDAIVLFNDAEISRLQKRAIHDFFYGLIQYRDNKIASGEFGPSAVTDTEETNRQLGERSPYNYSDESPDNVTIPGTKELQNMNLINIAKNVAAQSINAEYQPTVEDYVDAGEESPVNATYIPTTTIPKEPQRPSMFSLESLIRPVGGVRKTPLPQPVVSTPSPTSSQPTPQPVDQTVVQSPARPVATTATFAPTPIPTRSIGFDLTQFITGGRGSSMFPTRNNTTQSKPLVPPLELSPIRRSQPVPQPVVAAQPTYRKGKRGKNVKPKLNRKKSMVGVIDSMKHIGSLPRSITLKSIMGKSTTIKPIKKYTPPKNLRLPKAKSDTGLATIRNMDQVFNQIKKHSKNNYSGKDMKMPIVSDIKRQCDHAFKNNSFKVEAMNMKNNYFDDVKGAYPKIRMEMEMMGDIHENHMMGKAMRGLPTIVNNVNTSAPYIVKRGSMRPAPVGITDYDFDLGNVFKKKKKIIPIDEDIFYED